MTEQGGNKRDGENRERRVGKVVNRTSFPAAEFATGLFHRHDRVSGAVPLVREILGRYRTSVRQADTSGLPLVQGRPAGSGKSSEKSVERLDSRGSSGPGQRGTGSKALEKPVQRLMGPDTRVMKRRASATTEDVKKPSAPLIEISSVHDTGGIYPEPLLKKQGGELSTSPDPVKASVAEKRTESRIADERSVMPEPLVAQSREDGVFSSKTVPKAGRAFARQMTAGESPPYVQKPSSVTNPVRVFRKTDESSAARESGQILAETAIPPAADRFEGKTAPVHTVTVGTGTQSQAGAIGPTMPGIQAVGAGAGHVRDQNRHHPGHNPFTMGLPRVTGNGRVQAGTVESPSVARSLVQARTVTKDSGMKNSSHGLTMDSLVREALPGFPDRVAVPNVPGNPARSIRTQPDLRQSAVSVQRMADKTEGPSFPMPASPVARRQSLIRPSSVETVQAKFQPVNQSGLERMTPETPESQALVKVNPKETGESRQTLNSMPQDRNMPLGMNRSRMVEQVVRRVEDRLNRRDDDAVRDENGQSTSSSRPSPTPSPETSRADGTILPGNDIAALADQVYSLIMERLTIEKESLGL